MKAAVAARRSDFTSTQWARVLAAYEAVGKADEAAELAQLRPLKPHDSKQLYQAAAAEAPAVRAATSRFATSL